MEQRQRRERSSHVQRNDNDTEERDPLNLSGEENQDEIIPSNQLAAGNHSQRDNASQSGSRQPVRGSQDEEDEDDLESWGILTQYIGPSTKPKTNNHGDDEDRKHQAASKELDSFKKQYAADTDLRDRADNHLESLNRTIRKGRTPKGLTVDVQPNCVKKEDPTLKSEWATCQATAEHGFTNILTRHLERVSKDTTEELRHQANEAYRRIKKIKGKQPAKDMVENTLKHLKDDQKIREEQRQKRRLEAQTETRNPKKPRQQ